MRQVPVSICRRVRSEKAERIPHGMQGPAKSNPPRHPTIHSCHRACNTRVAPFEIAVRFHNIRVDPVVLVGVFLLLIAGWLLPGGMASSSLAHLLKESVRNLMAVCLSVAAATCGGRALPPPS